VPDMVELTGIEPVSEPQHISRNTYAIARFR